MSGPQLVQQTEMGYLNCGHHDVASKVSTLEEQSRFTLLTLCSKCDPICQHFVSSFLGAVDFPFGIQAAEA